MKNKTNSSILCDLTMNEFDWYILVGNDKYYIFSFSKRFQW